MTISHDSRTDRGNHTARTFPIVKGKFSKFTEIKARERPASELASEQSTIGGGWMTIDPL
jgi:hypothetical protein